MQIIVSATDSTVTALIVFHAFDLNFHQKTCDCVVVWSSRNQAVYVVFVAKKSLFSISRSSFWHHENRIIRLDVEMWNHRYKPCHQWAKVKTLLGRVWKSERRWAVLLFESALTRWSSNLLIVGKLLRNISVLTPIVLGYQIFRFRSES